MQEQRAQRRRIETNGFLDFFNQKLKFTGCKTDVLLRDDLYRKYKMYCKGRGLMPATIVNVGRTLAKKGVKSPTRIGGMNGKGQKYGYTGIVFQPCMEVVPYHPYSAVYSKHSDSMINGKRKLEEQDQNEPKRAKITGEIKHPISTFLEGFISTSLDHTELVRQNDLFNEYREYCRQNGLDECDNIKLGRLMTARGFKPTVRLGKPNNHKYCYPGLKWTSEAPSGNNYTDLKQQSCRTVCPDQVILEAERYLLICIATQYVIQD
ncbi:hypothetical protein Hamer_G001349 [Homarus americanus]|uniref:Uncharacterized protein n=1 Tax=Homarus americanus TaxID=6706 RepID=A0A8J5N7N8_HOMAM|nr:hypothetical protein Hamer_G029038 [Homarus americanus]KAG7175296.1 hypothetical protein Hamer_G001349 [Homarus americanus]